MALIRATSGSGGSGGIDGQYLIDNLHVVQDKINPAIIGKHYFACHLRNPGGISTGANVIDSEVVSTTYGSMWFGYIEATSTIIQFQGTNNSVLYIPLD